MFEVLLTIEGCSSPALGVTLSILKRILGLIQLFVPIILIIAGVIHLIKLMSNPEEKKSLTKVKNSVLAAIIVFIIPILMNIVMGLLDDTTTLSECWNNIHIESGEPTYVETDDTAKSGIYNGEYEPGNRVLIEGNAMQIGDVIWDSNDVTKISNLTSTQLVGILNAYGGNAKNFIPYASGLIAAEQKYSVNVFFLLGVEALESGWATSAISRSCHNLGGVCQTSSHPSNNCGSNSNCSFAYFQSLNEFIDYHASMLHTNYLTLGGAYYHGTSPSAVVTNYCPGCDSWPSSVTSIANGLFSKVSSVI